LPAIDGSAVQACRSTMIFGVVAEAKVVRGADKLTARAIRHACQPASPPSRCLASRCPRARRRLQMIRSILTASALAAAVVAGPALAQVTAPMAPASNPAKAAVPAAKKVGAETADTARKAGHVIAEDSRKVGHLAAEGGRAVASGAKTATAKTKEVLTGASSPK
jgi:hypothetical protein